MNQENFESKTDNTNNKLENEIKEKTPQEESNNSTNNSTNNIKDTSILEVIVESTDSQKESIEGQEELEEKAPLTLQQMMNRFVPFKEMPVGTVFELSGLRMRKMEYARRPDGEEGYFNALQLGIEEGYMWVKEDNMFKVVPANPRKNNNRNRRKKNNRNRNRNRSNTNNNPNSNNNKRTSPKPSNNNNKQLPKK